MRPGPSQTPALNPCSNFSARSTLTRLRLFSDDRRAPRLPAPAPIVATCKRSEAAGAPARREVPGRRVTLRPGCGRGGPKVPKWGLTKTQIRSEPWGLPSGLLVPDKTITNSVEGDVYLTRVERLVVDSPPMQRLRRVRQLGNTAEIYPDATHTRFSHALGALRCARPPRCSSWPGEPARAATRLVPGVAGRYQPLVERPATPNRGDHRLGSSRCTHARHVPRALRPHDRRRSRAADRT